MNAMMSIMKLKIRVFLMKNETLKSNKSTLNEKKRVIAVGTGENDS